MRPEVLSAMLPYFSENAGNASSLHRAGQLAKKALEESCITRGFNSHCLYIPAPWQSPDRYGVLQF